MSTAKAVTNVAVVGLGFGVDFVPIYLSHPGVGRVAICDADLERLAAVGDEYGVVDRFPSIDALLADDDFDAVHLVTPVTLHAAQAVAVLQKGRHVASAVPMGLTLNELDAVIAAADTSGKNYMMMETAVYQREFLYVQELLRGGQLGQISFVRGSHIRDRTEMPAYWRAFPPMKYATHVVSPLLALLGTRARYVHGFGSGQLSASQLGDYGNHFPLETSIFSLASSEVTAEVTQGCFNIARSATEGFSVYGDRMSVEWPTLEEDDGLTVFTMYDEAEPGRDRFRRVDVEIVKPPDDVSGLPAEIARFTRRTLWQPDPTRDGVSVPAHHGGSHPHLVHEFVSSILEGRRPRIDERTAATWCAPGICAHESALRHGARIEIPNYSG